MLPLVHLAFRNLSRNRARSLLTFFAIFLGVTMTLLLSGFGEGLTGGMRDDVVFGKTGAIQVHKKGYADVRDNQPLALDMPEGGELEDKLRQILGVTAVAPRIVFSGLVNNGQQATMFVGRGVDPQKEFAVLPWAKDDVDGAPISSASPTGSVMGLELAQALGASVGSTLMLQATTQQNRQNAAAITVVGTLGNANVFQAKRFINVPLPLAQELLRMRGRITEYVLAVEDINEVDAVAARVRSALGSDYEVETWKELNADISDRINVMRAIIGFIAFVFLVIVVFGVVNTMMMSVLERTREIGTMMALGVRRARISLLFVLEAAFLAIVGSGSGVLFGKATNALFVAMGGFAFAPPGATVVKHNLMPVENPTMVTAALVGATVGAIIAALYPAWRAARLRPVEALRAV